MKRKAKRIIKQSPKAQPTNLRIRGQNLDGFGVNVPPETMVVRVCFDQKGEAEYTINFLTEHKLL